MSRESTVVTSSAPATRRANWVDRAALHLLARQLDRVRTGALDLRLPDGTQRRFGAADAPGIHLEVDDWSFFRRVVTGADIGAGESYMDGHWRCDDLPGLLRMIIESGSHAKPSTIWARIGSRWHALGRYRHANTLRGSRRNIGYHYDLGNELYRTFLDATMMYSCAEFEGEPGKLFDAQKRKLESICHRLEIGAGDHVLEIGSGWGGFALYAARERGCHVTTITLSEQQLAYVRERADEAGLAGQIDARLCDYRRADGIYDRIVSIEMFEAVGYEYYRAFFEACQRLLRPGGRMFLQTITIPDQRFDSYRRSFDFIRKYVFPGGLLSSLHEIFGTLRRHTTLQVEWLRDIGPDYATTLRTWRSNFLARMPEVRRLGYDDRFVRMWDFYLAGCEALFAARSLGDAQLLLRRPV